MGNCLAGNKLGGGGRASVKKSVGDDGDKLSPRAAPNSLHVGLLYEQTGDVYTRFEEVERLGTGSMGHVSRVRLKDEALSGRKRSGNAAHGNLEYQHTTSTIPDHRKPEYALKSIHLDRISPSFVEELSNEIDILKTMDHPNIVKLLEVFYQKNKQIFLVLELCDGGDLYTRLPYSEKDAAYITGKLLSAIKYIHDHGIVHRDCTCRVEQKILYWPTHTTNLTISLRSRFLQ